MPCRPARIPYAGPLAAAGPNHVGGSDPPRRSAATTGGTRPGAEPADRVGGGGAAGQGRFAQPAPVEDSDEEGPQVHGAPGRDHPSPPGSGKESAAALYPPPAAASALLWERRRVAAAAAVQAAAAQMVAAAAERVWPSGSGLAQAWQRDGDRPST
jgi:hypothetical protein